MTRAHARKAAGLRRVWNNLVYGGKSGDPDADRNTRLYAAALFVVDQILREDVGRRASFNGLYQCAETLSRAVRGASGVKTKSHLDPWN